MMLLRVQVLSWWVGVSILGAAAQADCFDFSKKVTEPLRPVSSLSRASSSRISKSSGQLKSGAFWGAVRGEVARPITALVGELSAHEKTRSKRIDHMSIAPIQDPNYLFHQKVSYEVDPFPFITVSWIEDWAFSLVKGAATDPEQVVASYEKTEGTSHIQHLCGSYVFTKMGPSLTDVFIYEEAQATQRSQQDTVNGLVGTISTLRRANGVD